MQRLATESKTDARVAAQSQQVEQVKKVDKPFVQPFIESHPNHADHQPPTKSLSQRSVEEATLSKEPDPQKDTHSKLHRFVSSYDKEKLDAAASNSIYGQQLDSLLKKGFESELPYLNDTYNVLYWGLRNGRLTQKQFLDNLQFLTLTRFFLSSKCESNDMLPGHVDLADSIRTVTPHELELCEYCAGDREQIQSLYSTTGNQHLAFEIKLSDDTREALSAYLHDHLKEDQHSSSFQIKHHLHLLDFISQEFMGVWLTIKKDKIVIGSFSLIQHFIEPVDEEIRPMAITPGFGAGSWEDTKKMISNGEYPIALWHPLVSNSRTQSNGYWTGASTYLADFYHAARINELTPAKRQELLALDTDIICPRISFYQRFATGTMNQQDEQFIRGFCVISEGEDAPPANWPGEIQGYYEDEQQNRIFIDQTRVGYTEVAGYLRPVMRATDTSGQYSLQDRLEHHYFLFHLLSTQNKPLAKKILGIDISEPSYSLTAPPVKSGSNTRKEDKQVPTAPPVKSGYSIQEEYERELTGFLAKSQIKAVKKELQGWAGWLRHNPQKGFGSYTNSSF